MLFFENRVCGACGHRLGYLPGSSELSALETEGELFRALAADGGLHRFCTNARYDVCNWLVDAGSNEALCAACRHNRTIPDLSVAGTQERWTKLELAKHRLFYSLIRLGLRLPNRSDDPREGLVFDFLDESPGGPKVMTGHDSGVITIAAKEADDAVREELRHRMHETYRTLLGHFRHEVGHWIWDVLVRDGGRLEECRALFGDERGDYVEALKRHYREGARPDWQAHTITAYASSHPWEDFAETWAHYLHIIDTLDTGSAFGMTIRPGADRVGDLSAAVTIDPYRAADMDEGAGCVVAAGVRGQQPEPQHGACGSLPVHHQRRGAGQAALHAQPDARGVGISRSRWGCRCLREPVRGRCPGPWRTGRGRRAR